MADDKGNYEKVFVEPAAFVSMLLHARQHAHEAVHGVLLGTSTSNSKTLTVTTAVPVCHGTPVQPWLETSLALVEAQLGSEEESKIVGWYTAPLLLDDVRPGPMALRMTSILDSASTSSSTLIVLNNQAVGACFHGDTNQVPKAVQAFGKDFGNQFQQEISTMVPDSAKATKGLIEAVESKIVVQDFLDHLEEDDASTTTSWWELSQRVRKVVT